MRVFMMYSTSTTSTTVETDTLTLVYRPIGYAAEYMTISSKSCCLCEVYFWGDFKLLPLRID